MGQCILLKTIYLERKDLDVGTQILHRFIKIIKDNQVEDSPLDTSLTFHSQCTPSTNTQTPTFGSLEFRN